MKYWSLHILVLSIIVFVWFIGYNNYLLNRVEVSNTMNEMIDTILYETPIEREIIDTLYLEMPHAMIIDSNKLDTTHIIKSIDNEPTKIIVNKTVIDTIFDTLYIKIPVYKEQESKNKSTPILVSLEVVVTIIGGLFNILIGFFQLNERKKNNK